MNEQKNDTKRYLKPSDRFVPEIEPTMEHAEIDIEQLSLFENITLAHIDKNYIANAKVVNDITRLPISKLTAPAEVDVGQNVTVLVEFGIEAGIELSSNHDFTYFDKAVFDAICTRYEAGDKVFSIRTIYRTMHNYDSSNNPSDARHNEIMNSIRKMNQIKVSADLTNHVRSYMKKSKEYSHLSDDEIDRMVGFYKIGNEPLIDYRTVEAQIQGAETEAIYLVREPFLYTYSKAIKHVQSVPSELLNLGSKTRTTTDRTAIIHYLISRIETMKSQKERSRKKVLHTTQRTIRYDRIYEIVEKIRGKKLSSKVKRTKREEVNEILRQYRDRKYIRNFDIKTDGGQADTKVILDI